MKKVKMKEKMAKKESLHNWLRINFNFLEFSYVHFRSSFVVEARFAPNCFVGW